MVLQIISILLALMLFNTFFLGKYYLGYKKQQLTKTYKQLGSLLEDYNDNKISKSMLESKANRICEPLNISAVIFSSDWKVVYATENDSKKLIGHAAEQIFGMNTSDKEVYEKTDKYIMQRIYDDRMDDDYIEIWGDVTESDSILLRIPIKSISDSTKISNKFIMKLGVLFIVLTLVTTQVISRKISNPIRRLSELSKKMSEMDFEDRYQGNYGDEIDILGNSLNELSDKLEEKISELKTANNEMKNDIANKEAREQQRTEFISAVSHELKTPIALIQGYAEGLKEDINDSPENKEYYCDVIIDEAMRMNKMVRALLSLNQLESGNDQYTIEKFDLGQMISAVIENNKIIAEQKGITVINKLQNGLFVWADEFRIEEVFINYLTNAFNHCDNEKIITVYFEKKTDDIYVYVKNTGKKLPEEEMDKIWDKFYKVDKSRSREYGGNGIGLSIVKAIMEGHNKDYGVRNVDNGVEFYFSLDANPMGGNYEKNI